MFNKTSDRDSAAQLFGLKHLCDAVNEARNGKEVPQRDFLLCGTIPPLTSAFFDADAPIVDTEKGGEVICLRTSVRDMTGTMPVCLWSEAANTVFGRNASGMRDMWEQGVEKVKDLSWILLPMLPVFCRWLQAQQQLYLLFFFSPHSKTSCQQLSTKYLRVAYIYRLQYH